MVVLAVIVTRTLLIYSQFSIFWSENFVISNIYGRFCSLAFRNVCFWRHRVITVIDSQLLLIHDRHELTNVTDSKTSLIHNCHWFVIVISLQTSLIRKHHWVTSSHWGKIVIDSQPSMTCNSETSLTHDFKSSLPHHPPSNKASRISFTKSTDGEIDSRLSATWNVIYEPRPRNRSTTHSLSHFCGFHVCASM